MLRGDYLKRGLGQFEDLRGSLEGTWLEGRVVDTPMHTMY